MLVWPEERADDVVVAVVVVGVDVRVGVGADAKPGSRLDLMQQWKHKRWNMIRVQFEEKPALKKIADEGKRQTGKNLDRLLFPGRTSDSSGGIQDSESFGPRFKSNCEFGLLHLEQCRFGPLSNS